MTDIRTPTRLRTWQELYRQTLGQLPAHEARWLVEEASGYDRADWFVAGRVSEEAARRLLEMVARRLAGEPLQYVLGRWSFRTLDLMVDHRVLIPRPETEQLVEVALRELAELTAAPNVVDLGTGSGAIALSVAAEHRRARVWATDVSADALDVARANLSGRAGSVATRVTLAEGDWWSALPEDLRGSIDMAIANPPYVSSGEMATLDDCIRDHEPRTALEAGPTGLEAIRQILEGATAWLRPTGVAVIEMAPYQSDGARRIALDSGFADVEIRPDLTGRERILVARAPRTPATP